MKDLTMYLLDFELFALRCLEKVNCGMIGSGRLSALSHPATVTTILNTVSYFGSKAKAPNPQR